MARKVFTEAELLEALNLSELHGGTAWNIKKARPDLAISNNALDNRILRARLAGLKPTVKVDAPRIYTKQRLGTMHMVIPDTQVKHGVNTDHLEAAGNYAAEKRPDVIIMIGDWWDMESLSSYDKGKLAFEGRRYIKDIKAGREAMERFLKPIKAVKDYKPRMVFTLGNHEQRIVRFVDDNPEFCGKFGYDELGLEENGWEVHDFLKPVKIDGILYCHYFTSGTRKKEVSSAAALLRNEQASATMGHSQRTDIAVHPKTQNIALFSGIFYSHDEAYLGYQDNNHRRQIVIKHEVDGAGHYDLMFVSLKFLTKCYL